MQKSDLQLALFRAPFVTATCSRLQMTTWTKIGQNFDRSILMDKDATCLSKIEVFLILRF